MLTCGSYRDETGIYGAIINIKKRGIAEVLLSDKNNQLFSAFKRDSNGDEFAWGNMRSKEVYKTIITGIKGCTSKNGIPEIFVKGTAVKHEFTRVKTNYLIELYNDEFCGAVIQNDKIFINLSFTENKNLIPNGIPYTKLSRQTIDFRDVKDGTDDEITVRKLSEIALEKDLRWLKDKKYYIVNDEVTAESIFRSLERYKGTISYDTETTGLRINMFGQVGSPRVKELADYNAKQKELEKEPIEVDKLVGIIFCVQPNVSYYFPCFNRKFKNLYQDKSSPVTQAVMNRIKAKYTVGELRSANTYMADYIRNTPMEEWTSDIILMENVRLILERGHILAHNGTFEWKVGWLYSIDTNLKEDTMLMHQLMFKFRDMTRGNLGEKSNLKFLSGKELSTPDCVVDQLDLHDFFIDYKEDKNAEVRERDNRKKAKGKGKKKVKIDFSWMDYDGAKYYAPADGDLTLQIFMKYKAEMLKQSNSFNYLYGVEVIVSCAIGYMEFYGHRLDENKIEEIKEANLIKMALIEHKIRKEIKYNSEQEDVQYDKLVKQQSLLDELNADIKSLKSQWEQDRDNDEVGDKYQKALDDLVEQRKESMNMVNQLRNIIDADESHVFNLGSPAQVTEMFFSPNYMNIPFNGDKPSVGIKVLKQYMKLKNPSDDSPLYPIIHMYSDWKKCSTLITKFFDNLQYYMYPGGFIFSSYGQISTATGRMSCSKPNAQQYPKDITAIVIPRDGYVHIDADFSQIEYRTLVAMANEEGLKQKFFDPDVDYHTMMASLMYGVPYALVTPKMRGDAKSFNFGIPYGMGIGSLAILLTGVNNEITREEAKEKMELYFKDQPRVKQFFNDVKEQAQVNGYTTTLWGRRRYYSFVDKDGKENNAKKAAALRQAGNAVIQGCLGGDTRIQTKKYGIVKIKDVVGNLRMDVWDGDKWSKGDITYSGKKQKCIVRFSNGQEMICSPIHKFLVKSAKGNERFVECKDLKGSRDYTNPHRVVINRRYEPSDFKYSSTWAYKYKSMNHKANNAFIDSIGDSFKEGVVLGRLASDSSILNREVGGSCILQYIAEHELNIVPKLKEYMKNLGIRYADNDIVREERNEKVNRMYVYSQSLVNEITNLDIKHQVHDNIFMDTELLRGFLSGFFDGDGGISGKVINLTFGKQYNFESMCKDIQKALLFFGIRSRYKEYDSCYRVAIKTNDNQKFLDLIGFVNEEKQRAGRELECIKKEELFGSVLVVESVEITDEYIDMYDVCNTDGGYYVADGVITHNTAADIFKISVARNFTYIRENCLLGLLLIINMIHDEQLMEVNCEKLNVQRVLRDIIANMEMPLDGFPPLFVGAGVSDSWAHAKGKMAEIHPVLAEQLSREADNMTIFTDTPKTPKEVIGHFDAKVLEFRTNKIIDYIHDPNNYNQVIHPVIGNLLGLQFDYGAKDEFEKYCKDNGLEKEAEDAYMAGLPLEELKRFIEAHNLDVDYRLFKHNETVNVEDVEEDDGYDDIDDAEEEEEEDLGFGSSEFALLEEDFSMYGVSLNDLIGQFGLLISKEKRVCGIDLRVMPYSSKEAMVEYIDTHHVEPDTPGALQVVFLRPGNVLFNTDVWVKGIDGSELNTKLGLNSLTYR